MTRSTITPYNSKQKYHARNLHTNSTLSEALLWRQIKGRARGYEFHKVRIDQLIEDFSCHE